MKNSRCLLGSDKNDPGSKTAGKNKDTAQLFEELKETNCKMDSMQDNQAAEQHDG